MPARARDFGILRRLLFAAAIRNIDEIIVCSPELEAWLVDAAGFRGRVRHVPVVLPLAPDWDSETPSGRLKESLDRYASHEYRVFSIGSFDTAYGFHHVVEAVEQIRNDKGLDIGVFLADGGLVKDDAYKHALIEGRDWVEIGDRVPRGCLAKVFEQSSVFVRACAYESYGLSRIEALWSGVPVIATNAGETRGMTIYDYGDVTALSKYLLSVLDGETEIDLNQWAEVYAEEARRNVEAWLDLITGPESS